MFRRDFLRYLAAPFVSLLGLKLVGCGAPAASSDLKASVSSDYLPEVLRIWSYYVPMTSYSGILEEFEGRHPLDRRVFFDKVRAKTNRVSGRRDDGTENRANVRVDDLRNTTEPLRIRFWHDDTDASGQTGHTLNLFPRYLEMLDAGEKVFVATGTFQGHFHIVMIDPTAAGMKRKSV